MRLIIPIFFENDPTPDEISSIEKSQNNNFIELIVQLGNCLYLLHNPREIDQLVVIAPSVIKDIVRNAINNFNYFGIEYENDLNANYIDKLIAEAIFFSVEELVNKKQIKKINGYDGINIFPHDLIDDKCIKLFGELNKIEIWEFHEKKAPQTLIRTELFIEQINRFLDFDISAFQIKIMEYLSINTKTQVPTPTTIEGFEATIKICYRKLTDFFIGFLEKRLSVSERYMSQSNPLKYLSSLNKENILLDSFVNYLKSQEFWDDELIDSVQNDSMKYDPEFIESLNVDDQEKFKVVFKDFIQLALTGDFRHKKLTYNKFLTLFPSAGEYVDKKNYRQMQESFFEEFSSIKTETIQSMKTAMNNFCSACGQMQKKYSEEKFYKLLEQDSQEKIEQILDTGKIKYLLIDTEDPEFADFVVLNAFGDSAKTIKTDNFHLPSSDIPYYYTFPNIFEVNYSRQDWFFERIKSCEAQIKSALLIGPKEKISNNIVNHSDVQLCFIPNLWNKSLNRDAVRFRMIVKFFPSWDDGSKMELLIYLMIINCDDYFNDINSFAQLKRIFSKLRDTYKAPDFDYGVFWYNFLLAKETVLLEDDNRCSQRTEALPIYQIIKRGDHWDVSFNDVKNLVLDERGGFRALRYLMTYEGIPVDVQELYKHYSPKNKKLTYREAYKNSIQAIEDFIVYVVGEENAQNAGHEFSKFLNSCYEQGPSKRNDKTIVCPPNKYISIITWIPPIENS